MDKEKDIFYWLRRSINFLEGDEEILEIMDNIHSNTNEENIRKIRNWQIKQIDKIKSNIRNWHKRLEYNLL